MTEPIVCGDAVRADIYHRLSSFFLRQEQFQDGTCSLCGATVPVNKDGRCKAQAALTQKRHTALEGHPIAFGSPAQDPHKRGYFSLTDQFASFLVHDEGAVFTGKVLPSSPLPEGVTVRPDLRFEDLLDDLVQNPRDGAVIAVFNKKADIELRRSSPERIVVNGGQSPEALDHQGLLAVIGIVSEHGEAAFRQALQVKRILMEAPAKARDAFDKLKATAPNLAARLKDVPNGGVEIDYAIAIVRNRARRAAQQQ